VPKGNDFPACRRKCAFRRRVRRFFSLSLSLSLSLILTPARARQTNAPSRGIVAAHASAPPYPCCKYLICVTRTHFLHAHVMYMYVHARYILSFYVHLFLNEHVASSRHVSSIIERVRGRSIRCLRIFARIRERYLDGVLSTPLHRLFISDRGFSVYVFPTLKRVDFSIDTCA